MRAWKEMGWTKSEWKKKTTEKRETRNEKRETRNEKGLEIFCPSVTTFDHLLFPPAANRGFVGTTSCA